jgi:nitrogen fixation/metabolism regulation signal transduction histidine kinase
MKIGTKMLVSYLLIVALFASIGVAITLNTMKMNDLQSKAMAQVEIENYAAVYQKGIDLQRVSFLEQRLQDTTNSATDKVTAQALIDATETYLLENLPKDTELYTDFKTSYDLMHNTIDPADADVEYILTNQLTARYTEVPTKYMAIQEAYTGISNSMANFQVVALQQVADSTQEAKDYANFSVMLSAAGITTIAAISVVMALVMGRRLTMPLKTLTNIAGKVSMGELDHTIDIKSKDEIGDLGEAFQRMINAFKMSNAMNSAEEQA